MKKIAIVTGASSGLGREFILQLLKKNCLDEIWLIARRKDRLNELCRSFMFSNSSCMPRPLELDLTCQQSFESIRVLLEKENPSVQYLINAAGFGKIGSWKDISLQDCTGMIDLNCKAAVAMTQLVLPYMGKGSCILEICSTAAFQPFPYLGVYSATKSFLYRYSRSLRTELLGSGIHVTAVCPYWIKDTEFISNAQKTRNSSFIRHFPLASRSKNVVKRSLADAKLGLPVSTPGPVCTLHRIAAKILPGELMMGIWELIRRL
ncbi:MAG: SDR family NAD(P)-dependent oxidoreductase [Lachnospiraceae bacterium]|nr:SDR family NAD(P)-dependent oxidoreductase [Lachnospiraceae bacterium]